MYLLVVRCLLALLRRDGPGRRRPMDRHPLLLRNKQCQTCLTTLGRRRCYEVLATPAVSNSRACMYIHCRSAPWLPGLSPHREREGEAGGGCVCVDGMGCDRGAECSCCARLSFLLRIVFSRPLPLFLSSPSRTIQTPTVPHSFQIQLIQLPHSFIKPAPASSLRASSPHPHPHAP